MCPVPYQAREEGRKKGGQGGNTPQGNHHTPLGRTPSSQGRGHAAFPQAAGDTGHGATAGEDWPFHSKRASPESPFHAQAFPRTENTGLQEDVGTHLLIMKNLEKT